MPRTARLDTPGSLQHVMIRGIERRKILRKDGDREDMLWGLGGHSIAPLSNDLYICMITVCYIFARQKCAAHHTMFDHVGEFLSSRRTHSLIVTFIRHPTTDRAGV